MRSAAFLGLLFLAVASAAPTSSSSSSEETANTPLVVRKDFFVKEFKYYEAEHDIVQIHTPVNGLNYGEDDEDREDVVLVFFVEANDNGLYMKKNTTVKKLLQNGRHIATPHDSTTNAYFAAKDGIYSYNPVTNEAVKFGTVDDDLISIAVTNDSDKLYVLTANKELYSVTGAGTKKVKIDDVKNAEQIVVDFADNLYYVDSDKNLFIVNNDGVKKVEGIKKNPSSITILNPAVMMNEGGIPVVVDRECYIVHPNSTVEIEGITIASDVNISAYSIEVGLLQYYAKDKTIYEFNILQIIFGDVLEALKDFLNDKKNEIEDVSTRSLPDLRSNKQK